MKTRRQFLQSTLASFGAPAILRQRADSQQSRPNILMLLTDDQRWDALGWMGNSIVQTPNVDRLSRQGVTFTNHFVTTSICMTSRASIFTGLYERSHGIVKFTQPLSPELHAHSYSMLLKKLGYRVGFMGKYGVGNEMPEKDFDYWRGFPGQGQYFHEINGKKVHLTRIMGDQALEFLEGCRKDQPFCLSISFKAPHVQDNDPRQFLYDPAYENLYKDVTIPPPKKADPKFFAALPDFLKTSEGRVRWEIRFSTPEFYQRSVKGYYRLVTGVDVQVGRILKKLEESGLAENTVVIFSSDNGVFLGERGLAGKWLMYEESIRTPLIVYDPRLPAARRGSRVSAMTLNIDIPATIMDLAGATPLPGIQGQSLLPFLRGEKPSWRKEWFYSHLFDHPRIPKSEGIRTERWKYIRYIETNPVYEELYDLEKDPEEIQNLATLSRYRDVLQHFRRRWKLWREAFEKYSTRKPWHQPSFEAPPGS